MRQLNNRDCRHRSLCLNQLMFKGRNSETRQLSAARKKASHVNKLKQERLILVNTSAPRRIPLDPKLR